MSTKAAHISTQGNLFFIMALTSTTAKGIGKEKSRPRSPPETSSGQRVRGSGPFYAMIAAMVDLDGYWKNSLCRGGNRSGLHVPASDVWRARSVDVQSQKLGVHSQSQAPGYFKPYTNKEG